MTTIFTTMIALMMQFANASSFSTTTPGSYYEVSALQYDTNVDKTYIILSRYDVRSKYEVHPFHFGVETLQGNKTVVQAVSYAQSRSDSYIKAISGIK